MQQGQAEPGRKFWRQVGCHLLFVLFLIFAVQQTSAKDLRHVLLLYPYDGSFPATTVPGDAVRERLAKLGQGQIVVHSAYLDLVQSSTPEANAHAADFLAQKYRDTPIDVVVALNTEALRFAIANRPVLAPTTPIVFCCVTQAYVATANLPADTTGVISDFNMARTLDLAIRLQPRLKHIYFFSGASDVDDRWLATYRPQLEPYTARYDLTYLVGLPMEELLAKLASLPPDSVILSGPIFQDGAGRQMTPFEATAEVAAVANAPVYVPAEPYLGSGVIGGYMGTFETAGTEAADLVLQILNGVDPADLPPRLTNAPKFRVDERAMQRWGLPESKLPDDTVILFHTPTLFEQYRAEVLMAGGVILFQTLLLITLVVQFHQRRVAEQKARVAIVELARANRMTSMGEMTATIAHEVNQPLAAIVANASAAQRWLDRAAPNIAEARTGLTRIAADGHRAAEVISTVRSMFADRSGERATVDLAEVTQNILRLAAGELTAGSVTLKADIPAGLPAVLGDRVQLQQVVLNLVLNAIEAMQLVPAATRVLTVVLAAQDKQVVLTVGDTGSGISAENQARIFDTFFTTKPKGMGMGLSICRTIMAAHAGELTMAESGPQGTLMRCVWPAKLSDHRAATYTDV